MEVSMKKILVVLIITCVMFTCFAEVKMAKKNLYETNDVSQYFIFLSDQNCPAYLGNIENIDLFYSNKFHVFNFENAEIVVKKRNVDCVQISCVQCDLFGNVIAESYQNFFYPEFLKIGTNDVSIEKITINGESTYTKMTAKELKNETYEYGTILRYVVPYIDYKKTTPFSCSELDRFNYHPRYDFIATGYYFMYISAVHLHDGTIINADLKEIEKIAKTVCPNFHLVNLPDSIKAVLNI